MSATSFTAETGRQQFLELFVSQLKYQNPLEPVGQEEFLQQLAQMSTVEGLENLNTKFDGLLSRLETQNRLEGTALLGLSATHGPEADDTGIVTSVEYEDGAVQLRIGDRLVPLTDVTHVSHPSLAES